MPSEMLRMTILQLNLTFLQISIFQKSIAYYTKSENITKQINKLSFLNQNLCICLYSEEKLEKQGLDRSKKDILMKRLIEKAFKLKRKLLYFC